MGSCLKRFIVACLLMLPLFSCPDGQCKDDSDCRSGTRCAQDAKQCVQCAQNSHCKKDEFCCRGACKAEVQLSQFCGCQPTLYGSAGGSCQKEYELGKENVFGPVCQFAGGALLIDTVAKGNCACRNEAECKTGANKNQDMKCLSNQCVLHDACNNICGTADCIQGSCACKKPADCTGANSVSDICVLAEMVLSPEGDPYSGLICACSGYIGKDGKNHTSCPPGQFCCAADGCCDKPCGQDGTCKNQA